MPSVPITRLTGGLSPADGSDPRTFPLIFNEAADVIDANETDITALEGRVTTAEADITELETVGFRFVGTRYYTSDGTFVKADPFGDSSFDGAKLRGLRVTVQGGGGGGGGVPAQSASTVAAARGGGGGATAIKFFDSSAIAGLAASVTVTRGGGGNGGAAGNNNGSAGGQSAFETTTASGGTGGFGSAGAAPPLCGALIGGTGSATTANADITYRGGNATTGFGLAAVNIANGGGVGSTGGSSHFSGGGLPTSAAVGGQDGVLGSGGGGALHGVFEAARGGQAGGNGIVIVDVFA